MRIRLECGHQELWLELSDSAPVNVAQLLRSASEQWPDLYARWCDPEGRLRLSLPVYVDGEHIRYRQGLETLLADGSQVYVLPIVAGG